MIVKNISKTDRCEICGDVIKADVKFQAFSHFYCLSCYYRKTKRYLAYWKDIEKSFKPYLKHIVLESL